MLRIRLSRVGRKNKNIFRVVVAEHKAPIKGRFIEILGTYDPAAKKSAEIRSDNPVQEKDNLKIDEERIRYWISVGAKPTDTVTNILVDAKILPAKDRIKKTSKKKVRKKEEKTEKPEHIESPSAPEQGQESPIEEAAKEKSEEDIKEETPTNDKETEKKPKEEKSTEKPSIKDKKE